MKRLIIILVYSTVEKEQKGNCKLNVNINNIEINKMANVMIVTSHVMNVLITVHASLAMEI